MASRPSFPSLADALRFLEECLDAGDAARLAAACRDRKGCTPQAFEALKHHHGLQGLHARYAGRDFPDGEDAFTLGGHASELGHVHIDFARRGLFRKAWTLEAVWVCR